MGFGYVRRRGRDIVDGAGRPLLLRGVGLGNWLLPEGYMWRFGADLASPRQIEARIAKLIGPDAATVFWRRFRDEFLTERDIARIAALGFDHVRLPINSRVLLTDAGAFRAGGFALVDRVVDWCEGHGIRVLLDLHGAPGGQTGTTTDDAPNGRPELFADARYRRLTVTLWREIARRYRHRTAVLGYDLLNEPLPNEWRHRHGADLITLYEEITAAVREVDPDHLIMYEGPHWATDLDIFTRVLDPNSVLQFHRYWCAPERQSIDPYLRARERLDIPVFMGEGGENTPEWIYTATRLYEQHGIGWNFWPWKKLDTRTSPVSARAPHGWSRIADPTDDVDPVTAQRLLNAMLENVALDRCEPRDEITNALFGRAPQTIPAWGYVEPDPAAPSRFAGRDESELQRIWHHPSGEPYADPITTTATAGQQFRFPLAECPQRWIVRASNPTVFEVRWSGDALVARATGEAVLHGIDLGTA